MTDVQGTRRLLMSEAAEVLGWSSEGRRNPTRVTRYRLEQVEKTLGVKLLFGLGKTGSRAWTTMNALRHAGLVDDVHEVLGVTASELRAMSDRVASLEKCVRLLSAELARLGASQSEVTNQIARYFTVVGEYDHRRFRAIVSGELPTSPNSGTKRLPGRPKGRRDLSPRKPPRKTKKKKSRTTRCRS